MTEIDAGIVCISRDLDKDRFEVKITPKRKSSDSSEDDSDDSVFEHDDGQEVTLTDTKSGRAIEVGKQVKLKLSDIQVSEGTLILSATMI